MPIRKPTHLHGDLSGFGPSMHVWMWNADMNIYHVVEGWLAFLKLNKWPWFSVPSVGGDANS